MIHSIFDSRYQIVSKIGEGGMGCVYEAEHVFTKRRIALKVIHQEFQLDRAYRDRFLREIELACRVQHPNAVQILDAGEAKGRILYMAMEFLEGETLGALLKRRSGGLGVSESIHILRQLGFALDAIHAAGLLHRDLKPDNIMILKGDTRSLKQCRVKLLDFGIARQIHTLHSMTGSRLIGTPEFMSPEQTRGEKLGRQSDIYNLGLVAYSMLTGKGPFSSDTPFGYVYHHNMTPVPPLSTIKGEVPEGMDRAIRKALAKDAATRYPSVRTFIESLMQGAAQIPQTPATPQKHRQDRITKTLLYKPFQELRKPSTAPSAKATPTRKIYYRAGLAMAIIAALLWILWTKPMNMSEADPVAGQRYALTGETKILARVHEELPDPDKKDVPALKNTAASIPKEQISRNEIQPINSINRKVDSLSESRNKRQITERDSTQKRSRRKEIVYDTEGTPGARIPEIAEELKRRRFANPASIIQAFTLEEMTKDSMEEASATLKIPVSTVTPPEIKTAAFRIDEQGIYTIPDEPAEVRGGMSWLQSRIRYPAEAMRANVSGAVVMQLMIDERGRMRESAVVQSIGFGCEEEVERALQLVSFIPGKVDNQPVKSWLTLTFRFDRDA